VLLHTGFGMVNSVGATAQKPFDAALLRRVAELRRTVRQSFGSLALAMMALPR
jgi:hypothetical protein